MKNKSNILVTKLETLQKLIYKTLESCKSWYFEKISKKLCSKAKPLKYYWSLLKTTLNDKKNYCIPSIIHGSKFVIDFIKKVDLIDSFFSKQCSVIKNNSVLPSSANPIIDQYLSNIELTKFDIKRIIWKLDPNKTLGHNMICIHMLKMSSNTIIDPFFRIFKKCLTCGIFSDDFEKGNTVPILKKVPNKTSKIFRIFFQSAAKFWEISYTVTC